MLPENFYRDFDLSERGLQSVFTQAEIRRGREYWASGRIKKIDIWAPDEGRWTVNASVQGGRRQPYTLSLSPSADGGTSLEGHCSCPVGYNCKHCAAVALFLIDKVRGTQVASNARGDVVQWLEKLESRLIKGLREPADRLCYRLNPAKDVREQATVKLTLRRQKRTADHRWSKGRLVSPTDLRTDRQLPEFTCAADWHIGALLRACIRPWDDSRQPVLEVEALAPLLQALAESGRCYWGETEIPLAMGAPRELRFDWQNRSGQLYLEIKLGETVLHDSDIYLIHSASPMFIDPQEGLVGQVRSALPTPVLSLLMEAPSVPEEDAYILSAQFERLPLGESLPPPVELETIRLPSTRPQPLLHIFQDEKLGIWARLRMDYGGREVSLYPEKETETWFEGGKRFELPRDLNYERAAGERLLEAQLKGFGRGGELCFNFSAGLGGDYKKRWLKLAATFLPQLERDGWKITWEEEEWHLLRAEDWDAEIEEGSSHDWFGASLGIQVGAERIDLRDILAQLIEQIPSLQSLQEHTEPCILPLSDGRYLYLPQELLIPLVRTLFTLFDRPEDAASGLLSRTQVLAAAVSPISLNWRGGKELQRVARQLSKPLKPKSAAKGFRGQLRNYQQEGLAWMQRLRDTGLGGVLADDMGLGKTVQVLAMLHAEKRGRRLDQPALIIAPTSLLGNWLRECERFAPTLSVLVWHGQDREMEAPFVGRDLVITSYGLLVRNSELLSSQPWHYVVLDEAQQIKNPRSKAAHCVVQLQARHRLCLSGTPMENHLGELWSLFNFAVPGYLGDEKQFRSNYRVAIEQRGDDERAQLLARRVAPFLLRRTKDQVASELPDKVEMTRTIPMASKQADLYENVRLAMDKRVRRALSKKGLARSHITVLDALLKLRQICCDPALLPKSHGGRKAPSAKRDYFVTLVKELVDEGRRILVFSQFTSMIALLEESLDAAGIPHVKLTGQTRRRDRVIEAFKDGAVPVFLISLKAGGVGLNLTQADTVIHYDPWWNPAVENQATDRAHRIGQDKTVFVYRLVAENTVEEKILALQKSKEQLADTVYREGVASAGALSERDIAELLAGEAAYSEPSD